MSFVNTETLLQIAVDKASSEGRHMAGLWLACQLRDNRIAYDDAEEIMTFYACEVMDIGDHLYEEKEALATLQGVYKTEAREPWGGRAVASRNDKRQRGGQHNRATRPHKNKPHEPDPDKLAQMLRLVEMNQPLIGSPAEGYLEKRGIPLELARQSKLEYNRHWYDPKTQATYQAVVVPIADLDGKQLAAHGRGIDGCHKITRGPRREGVFWTPGARDANPIILVEGPMDALSIAHCGYPAVARIATDLPSWFGMWAARRTVYVAWDSDSTGDARVQAVADACAGLAKCYRLRAPAGKDWNEALLRMGREKLSKWLESEIGPSDRDYSSLPTEASERSSTGKCGSELSIPAGAITPPAPSPRCTRATSTELHSRTGGSEPSTPADPGSHWRERIREEQERVEPDRRLELQAIEGFIAEKIEYDYTAVVTKEEMEIAFEAWVAPKNVSQVSRSELYSWLIRRGGELHSPGNSGWRGLRLIRTYHDITGRWIVDRTDRRVLTGNYSVDAIRFDYILRE